MEFSLWLVPARGSPADKALRTTMEKIAEIYTTPAFPPHVTLVGGVEGNAQDIKAKTIAIVKRLTPYEIQFGIIGSETDYYRKLFLSVAQSQQVMKANAIAQEMLGVRQGPYLPHCSLAYGDLVPSEITEIKDEYIPEGLASKAGFTASGIQLWNTSEAVKDWRPVAWFAFGET